MKRETRIRIESPEDAIHAAFVLFKSILENPEAFPEEFNGATFRPVERIEERDNQSSREALSFEVVLASEVGNGTRLSELERVLIEA